MEDMVRRAARVGLGSICFTDHMDYEFPSADGKTEFFLDVAAYFSELARLADAYKTIKIRRGVELGLKKSVTSKCLALTKEYDFDFVIGSTHLVNDVDPYLDAYWREADEKEKILKYYEATLENIKSGADFDVYGHIDYIIRYTPHMKKLRERAEAPDEAYILKCLNPSLEIIEEILKTLIYDGKGIELNTGGFRCGLGHPNPHERILKLYKNLGGEIITVGSDAHDTAHVGFCFDMVPKILKACGFKYYAEFKGRKPHMVPIG